MNQAANQYITIYTESNPNPNSLKFVLNYMLVPEGATYDFPDLESTQGVSPLAEELFGYSYVKRVFIMSNFITITKEDDQSWHDIAGTLKKHIKTYLEENKPLLTTTAFQEEVSAEGENEPAINQKIRNILDEYVRPAVESDGGAIAFHSFEEGTVKVLLQGACSGCPSSTLTLKQGIENLLRSMVPEVQEVIAEGV